MDKILTEITARRKASDNKFVVRGSSALAFRHSKLVCLQYASFDRAKNKTYASELIWLLGRNNFDITVGM